MRSLMAVLVVCASITAAAPTDQASDIIQIPIRSIVEVGLVDSAHQSDRDFWRVDLITTTQEGMPTSVIVRVEVMEALFTTNDPEAVGRFADALAAAAAAVRDAGGGDGGGGGGIE